jgi:hypothetical protein
VESDQSACPPHVHMNNAILQEVLSLPTRFVIARKKETSMRRRVSRRSISKQVLEISLFSKSKCLTIYKFLLLF